MSLVAPIARAQLPEGWIEERRTIVERDGYAVRAGEGATIEIKTLTPTEHLISTDPLRLNAWLRLALPDNAPAFTTEAERDAVLEQLTGEI